MIERRRHLLDEVFCSYDAFPAHRSFPGFQCFLHRNLLGLPGPLLVVVAWLGTAPGCRSSDSTASAPRGVAVIGDIGGNDERTRSGAMLTRRTASNGSSFPGRKIEKYSFRCSPFYRRPKRRQRRDHAQFQCAVRSRIKRARGICRFAWSTLRRQHAKFLSCHSRNSLWRIPRVAGGKQRQRRPIRGPSTRCDSSSQDSVWRDWRGPSSRMQMSRPQTVRKGVELFWRSRGKSQ
jgi:hypothetical protein